MQHTIKQLDTGHWEIDGYFIRKQWIYGEFSGMYYICEDANQNQIEGTDAHTNFEDALGEMIYWLENRNAG